MAAFPINLRVTGSVMVVEGLVPPARMEINVPLTASSLAIASISLTSGTVAGDLIVNGTLIANEFKTTVVSASITYRSGSTKQGDTLDDIHEVTGSLRVFGDISGSLSGTFFGTAQGSIQGTEGLTGSLQRLVSGQTYLVGGAHITITTASNGQVFIATEGVADVSASYVTIGNTGSLPNERILQQGTGIVMTDGGPGNALNVAINNGVVATLSGSTFSGPVVAAGGLTGSLREVSAGVPYLAAGPHISIVTGSNGQVTITGEGVADVSASYVVLGNTGSLPNERQLSASVGLTLTDNGPGSTVSLSIDDRTVATLSGSVFSGRLYASGGLTGSLLEATPGVPYLQAGNGIHLSSQSNGSILVEGPKGVTSNGSLSVANNQKFVIFSGTVGHVTATLSDHPNLWQEHVFKDADGLALNNNIIVSASAGFRIDNVSAFEISSSYGWRKIVYVGVNLWSIVGSGTGS